MRFPIRIGILLAAAAAVGFAVGSGGGDGVSADSETSAFIGLVNQYRAQNGVAAVQATSGTSTAAQWKAEDDAERNLLSPIDSLGRNRKERLVDYGVSTSANGGYPAYGYATGAALLFSYMQNPDSPYAAILCDPRYNVIGVGRTFQDPNNPNGASFGWVWAIDLAKLSGSQTSNESVDCEPLTIPTETAAPTPTPQPTATPTPTQEPTETPAGTPTGTPTPTDTGVPTETPAGTPTVEPTPTPEPTVTPTPDPTPEPTPTSPPKFSGDTDCDLVVGSLDGLHVLRETAGFPDIPKCIDTGDVDCDGDRDSGDALGILRYTAGLPVIQPPTCPPIGWPV